MARVRGDLGLIARRLQKTKTGSPLPVPFPTRFFISKIPKEPGKRRYIAVQPPSTEIVVPVI